eukprot:3911721-Pleurochrysis_carterae.AAC.1
MEACTSSRLTRILCASGDVNNQGVKDLKQMASWWTSQAGAACAVGSFASKCKIWQRSASFPVPTNCKIWKRSADYSGNEVQKMSTDFRTSITERSVRSS